MDQRELRELIAQPEGLKLDFKRGYKFNHPDRKVRKGQWDEFIKDVLALTNGNVGVADQSAYLVIGVGDELHSDGTRDLFDADGLGLTARLILDKVNSACRPPLPEVLCELIELDGKDIVVVTIPPSPHLHETTRRLESISGKGHRVVYSENTVFIRRNEEIHPASEAERRALSAEKKALHFKPRLPKIMSVEPSPIQWDSVDAHRAALARIPRYARWGDVSHKESYIRETGMRLPLFASPYDDLSGEQIELLETIHAHDRLLILGDPGMGKTVALERTVWEIASASEPVVPIYVPLIHYYGDLLENIRVALRETGHLLIKNSREVKAFIDQHRCAFLFDGLNEVASSHRKEVHAELGNFLRAQASHPCIITSRSQDNLWRRFHSRGAIEDAVVIQRITDDQARAYLIVHLGESQGRELHDRLNEALRGLSRIPLLLWLIKEAGLAGEELPGNRGQLFDRFVDQVLKREQKQPELVRVPGPDKKRALSVLAFQLQQEHRLACDRKTAVTVINQTEGVSDGEAVVHESLLNGLLVGERQVHFLHQAVHEYFVALRLWNLISSLQIPREKAIARWEIYSSAIALKRRLRKWARDDWWAEVIVQLAGITDQPMFLAKQVLCSNPWLAYWCSIEGQRLSSNMQAQIEQQTVEKLDSPEFEERLRVVRELARMENPRTIGYLIVALDDPSDTVQKLTGQTLARLGQPSVDPLLDSLTSATEGARRAATRTLGRIWNFPKIADLGAKDGHTRRRAAEVLGNMGDDRAVLPLVAVLMDSDEELRIRAARSLGKLGDSRAVDPLMRALEQTYSRPESRESVVISEALAAIGEPTDEPLLAGLKDPDYEVRNRALTALGHTWMLPAVTELASNDPETRREAARKLGELADERVTEPLLAALKDHDQLVRWEATKALGRLWQLPALVELGDVNAKTRQEAAWALSELPDVRNVEPLIAALRDQDSAVREYAADALGALGEISIKPLASLLSYKDRGIRRSVRKAFAKIEDDRVLEVLISAIQDHRWWVREIAAECLVKLGERGIPALEVALDNDDPVIRWLARVVLRRIGTVKAQTILRFGSLGKD